MSPTGTPDSSEGKLQESVAPSSEACSRLAGTTSAG
jgi:hypothetical protein